MTLRATLKTGDLNRLLKAAKAHGYEVVLPDGTRLLPAGQGAGVTPPDPDDWGEALAQWRRSV